MQMGTRLTQTTSRLLIDESPLQVLPSLATAIGLNEAIFLQQVHYWLKMSTHEHDGRRWIYNTLDAWHEQFPFFTMSMLRRTIDELRRRGLLLAENYNESKQNRTLWYSIDYEALEALQISPSAVSSTPFVQNEQMAQNQAVPSVQNEQMHLSKLSNSNAQNEQMLIGTETTAETTNKRSGGGAREAQKAQPPRTEEHQVLERLFAIFQTPKQPKRFVAAAIKRGGFTLADVELCEAWLAAETYHGKVGKLANILDAGLLPTISTSPPPPLIVNGVRRGPQMSTAPGYDIHEAKRRGAARKAELLEGLPSWA
jgi:hypothetical protein